MKSGSSILNEPWDGFGYNTTDDSWVTGHSTMPIPEPQSDALKHPEESTLRIQSATL